MPTRTDQTVARFAWQLQELRRSCGNPSFAELAKRTGHGRSTLNEALRGVRLPSLDLTVALARACGDDEQLWRQRWVAASRPPAVPAPAPPPDATPSGATNGAPANGAPRAAESAPSESAASEGEASSDAAAGTGRRPWWRRAHRVRLSLPVVAAVVVLVAAAAAGTALWVDNATCITARGYLVAAPGAVLDANGAVIGDVRAGDEVAVSSMGTRKFPHRKLGTVSRTGLTGYLDEAKLSFTGTVCR